MATRSAYANSKSLRLLYLNEAWTNIGNAGGLLPSSAAGNIYAALFVGASEVAYGSYARIAIPRSASGFSEALGVATNAAQINFVKSTSDGGTVTYIELYDSLVAGNQLHRQLLTNPIPTATNCQPIYEAGALTITAT
jgi:hypothetical protein